MICSTQSDHIFILNIKWLLKSWSCLTDQINFWILIVANLTKVVQSYNQSHTGHTWLLTLGCAVYK